MMGMGGGGLGAGLGGLLRGFLGGGPGGQSGPPQSPDDILREMRRGPAPARPRLDESPSLYPRAIGAWMLWVRLPIRVLLPVVCAAILRPNPWVIPIAPIPGLILALALWLGPSLAWALRGDRAAIAARRTFLGAPLTAAAWIWTGLMGMFVAQWLADALGLLHQIVLGAGSVVQMPGLSRSPSWLDDLLGLVSLGLIIANLVRTGFLRQAAKKEDHEHLRARARARIAAERRAAEEEESEDY